MHNGKTDRKRINYIILYDRGDHEMTHACNYPTLRINNKDEISPPPVRCSGRGAFGCEIRRAELLHAQREGGIGKQRH